jgi:Fe-Mn family superoxide dismutase
MSNRNETTWPVPLAVLNLYDLAYMGEKYGVWGKKQYAADWWRSLNWEEVVRKNAKQQ